jgi:hypothetical protein
VPWFYSPARRLRDQEFEDSLGSIGRSHFKIKFKIGVGNGESKKEREIRGSRSVTMSEKQMEGERDTAKGQINNLEFRKITRKGNDISKEKNRQRGKENKIVRKAVNNGKKERKSS